MKIGIIDLCKQIEDPRMNRKKVHKMETIIYISIAAVICGAQSWNEIEEFGNAKIAFFKSRIPGLEFIPSHDTFNRFFSQGRRIIFFTIFSFVISLLYCWLLTYYHLLMSIIFPIFIRYIKT